ncbi:MAG: glycosyltransferase [Dokdonia sp.]|jgi:glycosyltransferase involved in cell wall biosynthesis|nr:glycosyl transferase family 1 [Cytophagaceae bacterium]
MAKKVLIIAYYWPPAGGPGVQRWLKFAKYLPDFDITPLVYVPKNAHYPIIDNALEAEVPKTMTVIKTPIVEPYGWASALSRKQTKTISAGIIPDASKQNLFQKALLYARGNFFVPDARVLWVKPSIKFLKAYISDHQIDTVITTGPPHSIHLIGLGLKKSLPLRWIADFRDPWTTIGYHDKLRMTKKTKQKHKRLEKIVLNTADDVIVTSPGTKKNFKQLTSKPITVITNGFDSAINVEKSTSGSFTIAHIGSLLAQRNPEMLWKAMASLVAENPAFKAIFKLQLVGKVSPQVIESIKRLGLEDYLEIVGYVAHQKARQLQHKATLLLLIEIDAAITKEIIPGKIFEYLAAQRPILAVGPKDADVEQILNETNGGRFFTYDQLEPIKNFILKAFEDFQKGEVLALKAPEQYHRKSLTKSLARLIKEKM